MSTTPSPARTISSVSGTSSSASTDQEADAAADPDTEIMVNFFGSKETQAYIKLLKEKPELHSDVCRHLDSAGRVTHEFGTGEGIVQVANWSAYSEYLREHLDMAAEVQKKFRCDAEGSEPGSKTWLAKCCSVVVFAGVKTGAASDARASIADGAVEEAAEANPEHDLKTRLQTLTDGLSNNSAEMPQDETANKVVATVATFTEEAKTAMKSALQFAAWMSPAMEDAIEYLVALRRLAPADTLYATIFLTVQSKIKQIK